jgi:hypothetical protein
MYKNNMLIPNSVTDQNDLTQVYRSKSSKTGKSIHQYETETTKNLILIPNSVTDQNDLTQIELYNRYKSMQRNQCQDRPLFTDLKFSNV